MISIDDIPELIKQYNHDETAKRLLIELGQHLSRGRVEARANALFKGKIELARIPVVVSAALAEQTTILGAFDVLADGVGAILSEAFKQVTDTEDRKFFTDRLQSVIDGQKDKRTNMFAPETPSEAPHVDELRNLITHMRKHEQLASIKQTEEEIASKREQIARTDNTWVDTEIARIEVKLKENEEAFAHWRDTRVLPEKFEYSPSLSRDTEGRPEEQFRFNTSVFKRHIDMYKFYKNRYERELNDLSETLAADQRNLERIDKEIAEITTSELTEA